MTADESLTHAIKLRFGTAPTEPTAGQLALIKGAVQAIIISGRKPNATDWSAAVTKHCPSAGQYKYAGIDNSDLNTLLSLAIQAANRKG